MSTLASGISSATAAAAAPTQPIGVGSGTMMRGGSTGGSSGGAGNNTGSGSGSPGSGGQGGIKQRSASVRRTESNSFLSRESMTDASKMRQLQRPTRSSSNPALQRHHAFIAVEFPPVTGALCGFCADSVTSEKQYFICQRCTLSLHADCVDKRDSSVCENHNDLTSFEIIDVPIAEALQDKLLKINQVNALIAETSAALEAVHKKIGGQAEAPKLLGEELKLHEKKLKKFRHERGLLESLIFVEISDMSEEMRRYSLIDESEEDAAGKDSSKGSFARGIKDKVKLVLS